MDIEKEYKKYIIDSRIKDLQGRINLVGTEEDSGESIEFLNSELESWTIAREML
jgi:hypothetical protein